MGATADHLKQTTADVVDSLEARDRNPHAVPPLEYLTRMVDGAIATIGADPEDSAGWFAEATTDPDTGEAWVDGNPRWLEEHPETRAYWCAKGECNRVFFPGVDDPEYSGLDTPEARALDTTVMCGQMELACEVFHIVRWIITGEED